MKKRAKLIVCLLVLMSVVLSSVARADTNLWDFDSERPKNNTITYCKVKFDVMVTVSHGWIFTSASVTGTSKAEYEGLAISFSHSVKIKATGLDISVTSSGPSIQTTSNSATVSSGTIALAKSHTITISRVSFSGLIFTSLRVTASGEFNGINTQDGGGSKIYCEATDSMTIW